jgi:hypothetical protein
MLDIGIVGIMVSKVLLKIKVNEAYIHAKCICVGDKST